MTILDMCGISKKSAGLRPEIRPDGGVSEGAPDRPLSAAWVSEKLLAKTKRVWSRNYGRPVDTDEAVEILTNVRRLAEALVKAKGGG